MIEEKDHIRMGMFQSPYSWEGTVKAQHKSVLVEFTESDGHYNVSRKSYYACIALY
jgi:hypothetical protein